jgi:excisionase family DNA binding protein
MEIREELQKYRLYTIKEIEPVIGKSRQSIIRYINEGKLKAIKLGNQWRISEEALKEFTGLK